jgi:hypothetical protein
VSGQKLANWREMNTYTMMPRSGYFFYSISNSFSDSLLTLSGSLGRAYWELTLHIDSDFSTFHVSGIASAAHLGYTV